MQRELPAQRLIAAAPAGLEQAVERRDRDQHRRQVAIFHGLEAKGLRARRRAANRPIGSSAWRANARLWAESPAQASGTWSGTRSAPPPDNPLAGAGGVTPASVQVKALNRTSLLMPGASAPLGPALDPSESWVGCSSTASISSIGVTPKIGSFANCQPEDSAPIIL